MSVIENLANAGFITKTKLVGNETFENMSAVEMIAAGLITKTNAVSKVQDIIDESSPSGDYYIAFSYNEETGTVTGAGPYNDGDSVTMTAVPADGCTFYKWKNALNEEISTENPFTFTINTAWIEANGYKSYADDGEPIPITVSMY